MRAALFGIVLAATLPLAALAQDKTQTLADIRQELVVLNSSVMGLKRELSTTRGFGTAPARLLRPLSRHQPAIAAHRSPRTSRATLIARRRRWTPETFVPLQTSLQPLRRPIRAGH